MTRLVPAVECARECARLYQEKQPLMVGGIAYSINLVDGVWRVTPRGSESIEDWIRDFEAIPKWTPIGKVHAGFWIDMPALYAAVKAKLAEAPDAPLVIGGHSLGGAHARLLAAMCALDGIKVAQLTTIASPRPAFANVRRLIEKSGMPHENFHFNNDPVPLEGKPIPMIAPWEHTEVDAAGNEAWTQLNGVSDPNDLTPLRDHHLDERFGYIPALAALPA